MELQMNFYIKLLLVVVAVAAVFGVLWRTGQLLRLSSYVAGTKEELKKCTWPSREELKGSTIVVLVSILLLGGFTMGIDWLLLLFVKGITAH